MEHLASVVRYTRDEDINNLDELVRYSKQVAHRVPLIAKRVRIERPGCRSDVIAALRQMVPGLPDSYVSIVASVRIDGISIGYFNLTPSLSRATSLTDQLRAYNNPVIAPLAERYREHGVYQVASWETDPICVGAG